MTTNTRTKSSEELRQDVHSSLKKVKSSVDELEASLTPGMAIDYLIYGKDGSTHPRDTIDLARENPLGSSLVTLGALLLTKTKDNERIEQKAKRYGAEAAHSAGDSAAKVSHKASAAATQARDKVKNLADTAKAKAQATRQATAENLEHGGANARATSDAVSEKTHELKESGKRSATSLKQKASSYANQAKVGMSRAHGQLDDVDPLILTALGFGIGASTAAAIPMASREHQIAQSLRPRLDPIKNDITRTMRESGDRLTNSLARELSAVTFGRKERQESGAPHP